MWFERELNTISFSIKKSADAVIVAGTPTVVLLGHQVECRRPGTLGTASSAVAHHGFELGFGDCEPVGFQSAWSAGDRLAWCCLYVVDRVVAHLSLHSRGTGEVRELGEDAVNCCPDTNEFDAGGPRAGGLGGC
jgi:hypothetical protein